jgi:hypothetical protein
VVRSVRAYSPVFIEQKPEAARHGMPGYLRGLIDRQYVDYAIGRYQ